MLRHTRHSPSKGTNLVRKNHFERRASSDGYIDHGHRRRHDGGEYAHDAMAVQLAMMIQEWCLASMTRDPRMNLCQLSSR